MLYEVCASAVWCMLDVDAQSTWSAFRALGYDHRFAASLMHPCTVPHLQQRKIVCSKKKDSDALETQPVAVLMRVSWFSQPSTGIVHVVVAPLGLDLKAIEYNARTFRQRYMGVPLSQKCRRACVRCKGRWDYFCSVSKLVMRISPWHFFCGRSTLGVPLSHKRMWSDLFVRESACDRIISGTIIWVCYCPFVCAPS